MISSSTKLQKLSYALLALLICATSLTAQTPDERLTKAARIGNLQGAVQALQDGAKPDSIGDLGYTALEQVIINSKHGVMTTENSFFAIAKLLLEHGANPNYYSKQAGRSILNLAINSNLTDFCALLINHGATVEPYSESDHRWRAETSDELLRYLFANARAKTQDHFRRIPHASSLSHLLQRSSPEFKKALAHVSSERLIRTRSVPPLAGLCLDRLQAQPCPGVAVIARDFRLTDIAQPHGFIQKNRVASLAQTILNAALAGDGAAIQQALEAGADINHPIPCWYMVDGSSALHHACNKENMNAMKLLLNANANPNTKNVYGGTPLNTAMCLFQVEAVLLLLNHKAYINSDANVDLNNWKINKNNPHSLLMSSPHSPLRGEKVRLIIHILSLALATTTEEVEDLVTSYPELEHDLTILSEEYRTLYENLCHRFAYQAPLKGSLQMLCRDAFQTQLSARHFAPIHELSLGKPEAIIAPASSLEDFQADEPKRKREDDEDAQSVKRVRNDEDQEQTQAPIEITTVDEVPAITMHNVESNAAPVTMQVVENDAAEQLRAYRAKHKALHKRAH
jgi:ankyrin repeat protein